MIAFRNRDHFCVTVLTGFIKGVHSFPLNRKKVHGTEKVGNHCSKGSNKKLREVMAAYLLYKCKHLCMLIFRVVSTFNQKK